MSYMFSRATAFNADLSDWDVSSVTDMHGMFLNARSFERVLCGRAWVLSQADKSEMFTGSRGSISRVCAANKANNANNAVVSTTSTPSSPLSTASNAPAACPRCGRNTAGEFSCCVRGGAWFDQCGSPGDPNYEHTWADGIKSCERELWWLCDCKW